MRYSLKIVPTGDLAKMPPYTVQVEEVNDGGGNWNLADLDEKLVAKLNASLFEHDIEIDTELFDKVDESILFSEARKERCPLCEK